VGGLFGNQFGLILRLIDPADAEVVSERVESLGKIGMINYFGMQRFGQFSVKTHELGAMVIRREWK
jgi:tRNA pseudouridine13 synthase